MYDIVISSAEQWHEDLVNRGLDVVVDPLVLRVGEYFLQGAGPPGPDRDRRWDAIRSDIGALASFFDLIVLHDQVPAFNYADTFDAQFGVGESLGALMNTRGDKTLVHVDMGYPLYSQVKAAATDQLRKRMAGGPFVTRAAADEIDSMLTAVQYEWEPGLGGLEQDLPDEGPRRLARFLLGQLVFSGYAQQMGAPHVLAPNRASLLGAIGLGSGSVTPGSEADIYAEIHRRVIDAGPGWRHDELPWAPSFLPFLLQRMRRYREGPDVFLERAKDLRGSSAIAKYRTLRKQLSAPDAARSLDARAELSAAADGVARSLDSNRAELEWFGHVVVEVLPRAFGVAAGALVGTLAAGPEGAVAGGLAGVVGEEALRPVQERLWGWVLDNLPFRSAGKLLSRAVRAELELRQMVEPQLRAVWETGNSTVRA